MTIRFASNFPPPVFELAQGTDAFNLNIASDDYYPGSGATARIYVKKPSGLEVYNSCTINGNTLGIELTTQMTAEVGRAECQIEVSVGGKVANSFIFYLDVYPTIIDGSAIESTSEYTALQELINDATDAIEDCEEATATALGAVSNYFVTATYSYSNNVHLLTVDADYSSATMFRFVPSQAWTAGQTLQIKFGTGSATSYGAKTINGDALPTGAWAVGSAVIFSINSGNAYFPVTPTPTIETRSETTQNLGGNSTVKLVKINSIVNAYFTLPGAWGAGITTLSNQIPSGYRPGNEIRTGFHRAYSGNSLSNNGMQMTIGTDGTVVLVATDSMANNWTYHVHETWEIPAS